MAENPETLLRKREMYRRYNQSPNRKATYAKYRSKLFRTSIAKYYMIFLYKMLKHHRQKGNRKKYPDPLPDIKTWLPSYKLLGTDAKGFKAHMEMHFEEGMTWANHKVAWRLSFKIDPLRHDTNTTAGKRLFHYSNLTTKRIFCADNMVLRVAAEVRRNYVNKSNRLANG